MAGFKYILLMLIVAVLFSVFSFSLGNAFHQRPAYEDFCANRPYSYPVESKTNCTFVQPTAAEQANCTQKAYLEPVYGPDGCIASYVCNACQAELDAAMEGFNLVIFLFMSVLGIAAVIATLSLQSRAEVIEWVLNGFLLGGLISLFVGTVIYFDDAPRYLRPIIMLVELAIVIVVALRKMQGEQKKRK